MRIPVRRLAVLGLIAIAALPAAAQKSAPGGSGEDGSFTLVNRSGQVINEIYASPVTESAWGTDRLGDATLPDGRSFAVRMRPGGGCHNDLRVVYADGRSEERRALDTCATREVVMGPAPGRPSGPSAAPRPGNERRGNPSFNLVNGGRRAIRELYARPASEEPWGPDRLGNDMVQPGGRYPIRLPEGRCAYDLRVVWMDGRSEERRALDLCEVVDLSFR
ncbi:hypothetical protein [Muricoccus radiodurans]|uniref:hypothetical protein n=1 Tax=Muricoccus radiodurans TaxID=2231721 RepID=UPI003CF822C2